MSIWHKVITITTISAFILGVLVGLWRVWVITYEYPPVSDYTSAIIACADGPREYRDDCITATNDTDWN